MLSRKYYKAIAEILNKRYKEIEQNDIKSVLVLNAVKSDLINLFQNDNSRFDIMRFCSAVGIRE